MSVARPPDVSDDDWKSYCERFGLNNAARGTAVPRPSDGVEIAETFDELVLALDRIAGAEPGIAVHLFVEPTAARAAVNRLGADADPRDTQILDLILRLDRGSR